MNIIDKIQNGDFIMFYSDGNVNKTYLGILTDGNKIVALSDGRSHNVDSVGIIKVCPSDKMEIRVNPIESFQYVPVKSDKK